MSNLFIWLWIPGLLILSIILYNNQKCEFLNNLDKGSISCRYFKGFSSIIIIPIFISLFIVFTIFMILCFVGMILWALFFVVLSRYLKYVHGVELDNITGFKFKIN